MGDNPSRLGRTAAHAVKSSLFSGCVRGILRTILMSRIVRRFRPRIRLLLLVEETNRSNPRPMASYVRNDLSVEPLWSNSSRVIFNSMDRAITTPACIVSWLLCAVLVCLVVHPPHCDMCDGAPTGITSSPQAIVNQQQPATPEPCSGICWCCGFHGLPNANPDLGPANTVTSNVRPEPLSPVFALRSSIFRPPRTGVFSLIGHAVPLAWMLERTT